MFSLFFPCRTVKELNLSHRALHTTEGLRIPESIEKLTLNNNYLIHPPALSEIEHLRELSLCFNQLVEFPDIRNNSELQILDLWNNRLTQLPDLENSHLLRIDLSENPIRTIPSSWAHLSSRCSIVAHSILLPNWAAQQFQRQINAAFAADPMKGPEFRYSRALKPEKPLTQITGG